MAVALETTAPRLSDAPTLTAAAGGPLDDRPYRLSVEQYHHMIEHGILAAEDPVELLEGMLVEKTPKNPHHIVAQGLVGDQLRRLAPAGWFVSDEAPVTTLGSQPEPDITMVRGTRRDYLEAHPEPKDVGIVVEGSSSSLNRDEGLKKRIYARSSIPVYWVVNLVDARIEVYTEPSGPAETPDYGHRVDFGSDQAIPVVLDGVEIGRIAANDVLP